MKRLSVLALLATVAVFVAGAECQANGLFRGHKGCGECAAPCAAAPCAPTPVKTEKKKMTVYKSVMEDKVVEYYECIKKVTPTPYKYYVCETVMKPETRKEIICTPIYKDVEKTYTVMIPKTVTKEMPCTTYKCETVMVKECVPVCKTVSVTCVDECGRCHTHREKVTVMEERTRCVVKRTPVTEMKMVSMTVCEAKMMKCMVKVCEIQRTERPVTVNVCTLVRKEMSGVRDVCTYDTVKKTKTVKVCVMKPFEEMVDVAVGAPCTTACSSPACSDCGTSHRGLFRRGCK
jgi:hypothetical protein